MKIGFAAMRLAWALYIVPFLMAYTPILMNKEASWVEILVIWATSFIGFYCSAAGPEGFLRRKLKIPERLIFWSLRFFSFPTSCGQSGWEPP